MRILNSRNSQVVVCLATVLLALNVKALAQQPENAALLYYQAFLVHGEPNEAMNRMIFDFKVSGEIVTDEAITRYIGRNRGLIDLVMKAADISQCDWGYDHSQRYNLELIYDDPLDRIVFLLAAEATSLAEQGKFATALDRCVTLRKMALHACAGGTPFLRIRSVSINRRANGIITDVLGLMPPDVGELTRLKSRLTHTKTQFPSLVSCLTQEAQINAGMMRKDKVQPIIDFFEGSLGRYLAEPMLKRIREGDGRFFERNRDYYLTCCATFIDTLESGLPYTEMLTRLKDMGSPWSQQAEDNPDATLTSLLGPPAVGNYRSMIKQQTNFNALKTAIDLYIVKARTGQLPDTLPADSPPDMFSGKPFEYTKTDDGFVLRCRVREHPNKDLHEYKFNVK